MRDRRCGKRRTEGYSLIQRIRISRLQPPVSRIQYSVFCNLHSVSCLSPPYLLPFREVFPPTTNRLSALIVRSGTAAEQRLIVNLFTTRMNSSMKLLTFGRRLHGAASVVLLATAFCAGDAAAQNSTYNFLLGDVSARSSAMAGSFVSMRDDINTIFYNPAGLSSISQPQASFGFLKNLLDINSGYVSVAQEISGVGMVGFGVNYVNYGTFDETDELANKIGTFSAGDLAISAGWSSELEENLSYGIAAKFIYSSIAEARSSAIAADLGLLYYIPGANPVSFGLSLVNLGTQLNPYLSTRENLPLELTLGATVKPEHLPLLLNLDFHDLNDSQPDFVSHFRAFSVGGEFTMSRELRFRFGYQNARRRDLELGSTSGLAGFSFGGGLVLQKLRFDYAFVSLGKIGSLNSISVGLNL